MMRLLVYAPFGFLFGKNDLKSVSEKRVCIVVLFQYNNLYCGMSFVYEMHGIKKNYVHSIFQGLDHRIRSCFLQPACCSSLKKKCNFLLELQCTFIS